MERWLFTLVDRFVRARAAQAVMQAPDGYTVRIAEPSRTLDQNAKFHAICTDIARSGLEWAGKKRTRDQWKVLLVSGHSVVTKEGAEIVPGIEGEFINLRESTARMGRQRASSLIEYAQAFAVSRGVPLRDERDGVEM